MAPPEATAGRWLEGLERPGSLLRRHLAQACGGERALTPGRLAPYRDALARFCARFGAGRPVQIVRAPGRLNVLGMHIDHRGGYINAMALDREIVLVFSPADDDTIDVVNLDEALGRRTFRISEITPPGPVDETQAWLDWTQTLATGRIEDGTSQDWVHKLTAPAVYLARFAFPGRKLRGLSGVMTGNIPARVGLSSSSAVVVAMMTAVATVNELPLAGEGLVRHCGVAEWYVGTRGGFGDHASMICSKAGHLLHVRTVPELHVTGTVPFPADYRLLVFHSGHDADKTGPAGNIFNERTATYEMAEMLASRFLQERHVALWRDLSRERADLKTPKPVHLGDIAERLSSADIYDLIGSIPDHAHRTALREMLGDASTALERQFVTHREPKGGYRLRQVLLYGIAECVRAIRGPELLKAGDVEGFGRLMTLSHDGDRVSGIGPELSALKSGLDTSIDVWEQPGDYACSTDEIDAMVDIALSAGAVGAQVSGAGLGGSTMALVPVGREDAVIRAMAHGYFEPRHIPPNHLVAVPARGASVV
ncbi:MAG TPA: galactokinase family protein [Planctomycetota bacterium]|nr:galactokinase family protein [Planctomycetota bacterium]